MPPPHSRAGRFPADYPPEIDPLPMGRPIARVAARQHGVVAARQLVALGLAERTVSDHVRNGRLHRAHRGVYAVGHTVLTRPGRWMAAVLAAGPGAALSHASAAALRDLRRSDATIIDVSVSSRAGRIKRAGLRIHRPRRLEATEVTTHDRIPVTTPARTILDLAAILQRHRLERLLDQAEILELTDYPALDAIAESRTRQAFERDRRRDAGHLRAGYRTLRFTDRQLGRHGEDVGRTVAAAVNAPPNPSATVPKSPAAQPRARSLRMPGWP